MKNILEKISGDDAFGNLLRGHVSDLDPAVAEIVYLLYQKCVVRTTWSCEGHIDKGYNGYFTRRSGYVVHVPGKLCFEYDPEDVKGALFVDSLNLIGELYSFVTIEQQPLPYKLQAVTVTLDMSDLRDVDDVRGDLRNELFRKNLLARGSSENSYVREVPLQQATRRLADYYKFWDQVLKIVRIF